MFEGTWEEIMFKTNNTSLLSHRQRNKKVQEEINRTKVIEYV
mgnify:CR=1 FL=1